MVNLLKSDALKLGSRSGGAGSRGSCLAARGSGRNVCVLLVELLYIPRQLDTVVHSATALHGGAPVSNRLDILSQIPVAILIAAVAAVVPRVRQAPVPAICTHKDPDPA